MFCNRLITYNALYARPSLILYARKIEFRLCFRQGRSAQCNPAPRLCPLLCGFEQLTSYTLVAKAVPLNKSTTRANLCCTRAIIRQCLFFGYMYQTDNGITIYGNKMSSESFSITLLGYLPVSVAFL